MSLSRSLRRALAVVTLATAAVGAGAAPASAEIPAGPCTFGWSIAPGIYGELDVAGTGIMYSTWAAISRGPECVALSLAMVAVPAPGAGTPTTCAPQPSVISSVVAQQFANCIGVVGVWGFALYGTPISVTYTIEGVGTNGATLLVTRTCTVMPRLGSSRCAV